MKPEEPIEVELVERASVITGTHEMILWSDGSLTIEHILHQFEPDNPAYNEHIHLTLQERMSMYCTLYGPATLSPMTFIGAA
jgi:hypothetical protein